MAAVLITTGLLGFVFYGVMALPLIPREKENYFSEGLRVYGSVLWKVSLGVAAVGAILALFQ